MNSDDDLVQLKIDASYGRAFLPTSFDNEAYLECFWIPINQEDNELGYPLISKQCTLASNTDPMIYEVKRPFETLSIGKYYLEIRYNQNTPNKTHLTFNLNGDQTNFSPQYYKIQAEVLINGATKYTDQMFVPLLQPFALATVYHNSDTVNEYDYLFVEF